MTAASRPVCPACGSEQNVVKASKVYVAGITRADQRSPEDRQLLTAVYGKEPLSAEEVHQVSQQFGPPSGRSQIARPVHPDLAAGVFSLAALGFLINTFWTARAVFWIILALWLASLAAYAAARRAIVGRYRAQERLAVEDRQAVEVSVSRWMQVYYCGDDGCVFIPEHGDSVPLRQLQQYLLRPPDQG